MVIYQKAADAAKANMLGAAQALQGTTMGNALNGALENNQNAMKLFNGGLANGISTVLNGIGTH